jgi:hypothetical protein
MAADPELFLAAEDDDVSWEEEEEEEVEEEVEEDDDDDDDDEAASSRRLFLSLREAVVPAVSELLELPRDMLRAAAPGLDFCFSHGCICVFTFVRELPTTQLGRTTTCSSSLVELLSSSAARSE